MGWSVSEASYSGAGKTGLLSQSKELILLDQNSEKLFQMPKLLSITIPYLTLYIEEDNIQLAVLTPQSTMFGRPNLLSKEGVLIQLKTRISGNVQDISGIAKMCYGSDGQGTRSRP